MDINFNAALRELGPDAGFRVANAARPSPDYVLAQFLPERRSDSYIVEGGNMTVRPTMAGLVGMSSSYPPAGAMSVSTFLEKSAKLALQVALEEGAMRQLQAMTMRLQVSGGNTSQVIQNTILNFLQKLVVQAQLDTAEWLRGKALAYGAIDWTFNGINLEVDYGIPAANILTSRTGNDGYGGSASKFWTDWRTALRTLGYGVLAAVAHSDTVDMILSNEANSLALIGQEGNVFSVRRYKTVGGNTVFSSDARDTMTLIAYDKEGEVIDPSSPNTTIKVPFFDRGRIAVIGRPGPAPFRIDEGQGATDDPDRNLAIGYYHLAPTVEGGGTPGRWARAYTPESAPWQLVGQGASNELPVIEDEQKLVIMRTEMT